jgi:hypothetical protein
MFDCLLFVLDPLHLETLAFARGLGGLSVAQNAFDATLLLLIVCLGSLAAARTRVSMNGVAPSKRSWEMLTEEGDVSLGQEAVDPMTFAS